MMKFVLADEPDGFDERVRRKGNDWLTANPSATSSKYPSYWSEFKPQLAEAFHCLCGYTIMRTKLENADVEHYISKDTDSSKAYEWSNYRYSCLNINRYYKKNHDDNILDPFEVENDWFELLLPDCQLVLTDKVPPDKLSRAEFTLEQLQLQRGEWLIRERQYLFFAYTDGEITLDYLEREAPLLARAIEKRDAVVTGA